MLMISPFLNTEMITYKSTFLLYMYINTSSNHQVKGRLVVKHRYLSSFWKAHWYYKRWGGLDNMHDIPQKSFHKGYLKTS